jgi:hypothetical protein
MTDDTTSPIRRAAVEAAIRDECLARTKVNGCAPIACPAPCKWCRAGARAAIAAYLDGMGRTDEAQQVRRMASDDR